MTIPLRPGPAGACCLLALALALPALQAQATVLSDNTSSASDGSNSATSSDWLAASFVADASYGSTSLVASLLATSSSGTPTLSLYSSYVDGYGGTSDLIPDSALATFTFDSTGAGSTAFSLSNIELVAGTTYWLVLSSSGSTEWAWTATTGGSGAGYTGNWAIGQSDAELGTLWYAQSNLYPMQFSVGTVAAVPEPSQAALCLSGLAMLGMMVWRRGRANRGGLAA